MFLTRIVGELDHWEVTEETLVMKEKHVHHQAEVMGKEGLCNQEGCDQQPRGNKWRGWTEGREPASISMSESPRLASPGALGRGGAGRDQGSLSPHPYLVDEETDSAAVSALLGGMGQVCAEQGWMGQNPSLEDAATTLKISSMGLWTGSQPGKEDTWSCL